MNCQELQDHYELYAMGVAEEPEKTEIREHLHRGCEVCMTEMKRARAVTAIVGGTVPMSAPSAKLRRRILASIGVEQRGFAWGTWLSTAVAALALFGAVYFGSRERDVLREATLLREQLGQQNIRLTQLNEAFTILGGADTTVTSFGPGQPKGKVFVNPSQGVMLVASNLPALPAGKTYEMWLVPKKGNPLRAGEFKVEPNGTAMHIQHGAVDPTTVAAVAVTLENEGGTDTPTMPLVLAASLQ